MADVVENVLKEAAEKEAKYKTTEVHKDIDVDVDLGNLLTSDPNPIDSRTLRSKKEEYLRDLARDNTQILINKIWQLPTERTEHIVVAQLPDPKTLIPREKPVPKAKPLTKWEKYAKTKGIQKKKKHRMIWDEQSKSYKPRYGYKRANDDTKQWMHVVPQDTDPLEDQFAKRTAAKKERVAKNELQRLRNIARSQHKRVPGVGLTPTEAPNKEHLSKALAAAKTSTASIGKFTESLPKEKPQKNTGKKRKFEANHGDVKKEMTRQLDILNDLHSNRPIIDKAKAANMQQREWESARTKRRREDPDLHKKKPTGKRSNQGKKGNLRNFKGGFKKSGKGSSGGGASFKKGAKAGGGGGGGGKGGGKK
ncbi:ribosome biogenesis regulatory protein homolog [Dreissena polymorpha]|uniref:ribosome biogenesis regulatory protein homolog n=1 Tax=Dreissena polymorpha TaxID=45954 RepID=UPI002264DC8C|nr:ribosome biogenesis regulatory protein homolog [Dreissena polymorpha]